VERVRDRRSPAPHDLLTIALLAFMAGGAVRHLSLVSFGAAVFVGGVALLVLLLRERRRRAMAERA
jgi:Flp pilus assembly protein TadB